MSDDKDRSRMGELAETVKEKTKEGMKTFEKNHGPAILGLGALILSGIALLTAMDKNKD